MSADVRYARNGRVAVAHQILGDGPIDLVLVPGFVSHLDATSHSTAASMPPRRIDWVADGQVVVFTAPAHRRTTT
jgi:hypothetical protein